ncbi:MULTISPECIES: STAS domain-containing protein [unclassified Streptomyces]|uniref:STAS domain-containing protein n=1 Tax=unclassified Streptomyces TaxID=2593676 RepID=UPI00403CAF5D
MNIADGISDGFVPAGRWHEGTLDVTAADMTVPGRGLLRVLCVAGDVDIDTGPALEHALAQAARDRPYGTVVDLSGLSFGDSATLNALLHGHRALPALIVAGPLAPPVQRLLTLSGLGDHFTMAPDTEAAVKQLTTP